MATSKNSVFRPDNINKRVYTNNYGTGGFIGTDKNPTDGSIGDGALGSTGCGGPPGGGAGGLWKANESRLGVVNGCKAAGLCFGGTYIFDDAGTKWILAPCSTEVGPVPVGSAPGAVSNANAAQACGDWFLPDCPSVNKIVAGTSVYWDCIGPAAPQPAPLIANSTSCTYWGTCAWAGNGSNVCYWSILWDSGTGSAGWFRSDQANTFLAPWARARAFRCI